MFTNELRKKLSFRGDKIMKFVLIEPLGIAEGDVNELAQHLISQGHQFISYSTREEDPSILIERAKDADVVILTNLPFKSEVIKNCPNLKMISVAFTGVDHVDLAECKARDIMVCNCAGYSTHAVAELAIGMMVSLYRHTISCDSATRNGKTKAGLIGQELNGKTLGVVGTGAIGEKVIQIALAFGCNIIAYSRTEKDELKSLGVTYTTLDQLLAKSDIVSLHLPLNEQTKNLINAERLSLMKKNALFINVARGPIVDSKALAHCLIEGKLAGAGIDVFEMEPPIPSDHPLLTTPNTLLAPHVAFATHEALFNRGIIAFKNVEMWLKGTPQNMM